MAETKLLEVYSEASNMAVVRLPGRRFPGSVIQGDTLARLWEVTRMLSTGSTDDEIGAAAAELLDDLGPRLLHYQDVLLQHGIELPYSRRLTREDLSRNDAAEGIKIDDWILDTNVRACAESLAWLVDYSFDEDDWTAVRFGVANADAEAGRWYEYNLFSQTPGVHIALELAPDVGSSVVHVRAKVPPALVPAVRQTLAIFQHVQLADGVRPTAR